MVPFGTVVRGAGYALGGVYSLGKALENYDYWHTYSRRTGVHVRYPFRSGQFDYLKYASQSMLFANNATRRW